MLISYIRAICFQPRTIYFNLGQFVPDQVNYRSKGVFVIVHEANLLKILAG